MYASGGGALLSSFFAVHVPENDEGEVARLLDELNRLVIFGIVKVLGPPLSLHRRSATPPPTTHHPPTTTSHLPPPTSHHHLPAPSPQLFILTPASVVLPTPTGVFLPTFLTGGALGRAAGISLILLFPSQPWLADLPGHFAVAGAAAMTTAATRTLSTSVVTLELSGVLALQQPLFVACTVAYLVSRALKVLSMPPCLLCLLRVFLPCLPCAFMHSMCFCAAPCLPSLSKSTQCPPSISRLYVSLLSLSSRKALPEKPWPLSDPSAPNMAGAIAL